MGKELKTYSVDSLIELNSLKKKETVLNSYWIYRWLLTNKKRELLEDKKLELNYSSVNVGVIFMLHGILTVFLLFCYVVIDKILRVTGVDSKFLIIIFLALPVISFFTFLIIGFRYVSKSNEVLNFQIKKLKKRIASEFLRKMVSLSIESGYSNKMLAYSEGVPGLLEDLRAHLMKNIWEVRKLGKMEESLTPGDFGEVLKSENVFVYSETRIKEINKLIEEIIDTLKSVDIEAVYDIEDVNRDRRKEIVEKLVYILFSYERLTEMNEDFNNKPAPAEEEEKSGTSYYM